MTLVAIVKCVSTFIHLFFAVAIVIGFIIDYGVKTIQIWITKKNIQNKISIYGLFINILNNEFMENNVLQRIKEVLRVKNVSMIQVSDACGIKQNTFSRQLSGENALSASTLISILGYFNDISAEWLLRGEGEMFKSKANSIEDETIQKISGEFEIDENGYLKVKLLNK